MSRYRIVVIFLLGLLIPFVALCSNRAANAFVSVECRTKGVLGVYLNGEDFYLTVDRDCAGSNFVAQIEVAVVNPKKWVLLKPNPNKRTIAIGQTIEWRVKETKGKEDPVGGRILLIKLAIDKTERLAVEKAKHARYVSTVDNSAVLKLTADSDVGDSSVVWSSDGGPSGEGLTPRLIKSKKFPPIGKYRIRATCSKVPAYYDEYTVVVVRTAFIVYVDQPVAGSRAKYTIKNGEYDVGHAWWKFRTSNSEIVEENSDLRKFMNKPMGYYPAFPIFSAGRIRLVGPGKLFVPDGSHKADVSYIWDISIDAFEKGLLISKNIFESPGVYDAQRNNCCDAVIYAGAAVGVAVPDTGTPSNAGDLGEDLRLLKGKK